MAEAGTREGRATPQPPALRLAIRLWIGLTLLTALTGLGVSLYMLLS